MKILAISLPFLVFGTFSSQSGCSLGLPLRSLWGPPHPPHPRGCCSPSLCHRWSLNLPHSLIQAVPLHHLHRWAVGSPGGSFSPMFSSGPSSSRGLSVQVAGALPQWVCCRNPLVLALVCPGVSTGHLVSSQTWSSTRVISLTFPAKRLMTYCLLFLADSVKTVPDLARS